MVGKKRPMQSILRNTRAALAFFLDGQKI